MGFVVLAFVGMMEYNTIIQQDGMKQSAQTDSITISDKHIIKELKPSNQGFTGFTMNWITENKTGIVSYRVYQDKILLATVGGNSHSYDISGLKADTWYEFNVEACDASGNCANDGPLIGVRTISAREAAESMIDKINNLVSTGALDKNQGNSLITKLASIYSLDNDNAGTVLNQLQEFNGNVNALSSKGMIPPEESKSLTDTTNEIIRNIRG